MATKKTPLEITRELVQIETMNPPGRELGARPGPARAERRLATAATATRGEPPAAATPTGCRAAATAAAATRGQSATATCGSGTAGRPAQKVRRRERQRGL